MFFSCITYDNRLVITHFNDNDTVSLGIPQHICCHCLVQYIRLFCLCMSCSRDDNFYFSAEQLSNDHRSTQCLWAVIKFHICTLKHIFGYQSGREINESTYSITGLYMSLYYFHSLLLLLNESPQRVKYSYSKMKTMRKTLQYVFWTIIVSVAAEWALSTTAEHAHNGDRSLFLMVYFPQNLEVWHTVCPEKPTLCILVCVLVTLFKKCT